MLKLKKFPRGGKWLTYLTLIVAGIFYLWINLNWIFSNTLPPAWDSADYLRASEQLHRSLTERSITESIIEYLNILKRLAPLIAILPIPLFFIAFPSIQVALLINIVFLIVFTLFFFLLISKFLNAKIAIFSLVIVITMPLFYGLLRQFFVEFGLMVLVTAGLYFLLKTDGLKKRSYLFLSGIVFGLGELMKFHYFLFIIGPFFVVLVKFFAQNISYNRANLIYIYGYLTSKYLNLHNTHGNHLVYGISKKTLKRLLSNLAFVVIPACVIAGPWYIVNIKHILWHFKRATKPEILGSFYYGPPFSSENISRSLLDFINYSISSYYFFLFIFLLIVFLFLRKKFKVNYFLLTWFLVPFIIFIFGPNKATRLLLPLIPPVGIFIAYMVEKIFNKYSLIIFPILILPAVALFIYTSVNLTNFPNFSVNLGPILIFNDSVGAAERYKQEYWPVREILTFIAEREPKEKTLVLASENYGLNINTLHYYNFKYRFPLKIKTASYFPKNTQWEQIENIINSGDILMMEIGGSSGLVDINRFNDTILANLDLSKWQKVENNFIFPDKGRLLIYDKKR